MELKFKKNEIIDSRYQILDRLGEGGMSVVFRAKDKQKKRNVAIKFLKKGVTSSYVEDVIRFRREIEAVSKLKHPNIVKLYSSGEYKNVPYIVMESLAGPSLSDILNKGRTFGIKESIDIIHQLTEALDYVHGRGILHRDLKPGNIILQKKKNNYKVMLLDFGVAFIMELGHIKGEEEVVGTFGYMSPEATGIVNKRIDERSDLYSLGIIFYRLLTGELPFKAKETSKMLHQQVAIIPVKPGKVRPGISIELEEMVMKLLYKEQELRYQSAKGLLYDLERYQQGERGFVIGERDQKVKISYQTRLIGRENEINQIKKMFNKARDNQGRICLIGGEPGIGKSRLVEELRGYVYEEGGLFIGGRCLDQENKMPYQPFRDAINGYIKHFENMEHNDQEKERKRIKKVLGELGEIIIRLNGNMSEILGKVPDLVKLDPERENQRFLMVASNFFCNIGKQEKIGVIYLDDLQWADEGSIRLLEEISGSIADSKVLILGTFRSNEVGENHSLNRIRVKSGVYPVEEIKLEAFTYDRLNKMVAGLLGERESIAHELTRYIIEKSGGNPFFVINIIRQLVEEKGLVWKKGYWAADWNKIKHMPVSASMIDIILKRIEDLTEKQSEILYLGSVIGREFKIELLYPLVDMEKEEVVRLVDEAINMQLIQESLERGKKIFVHDKIRDAFYKKISKKNRQSLHSRVASVIEEENRGDIDNVIFELAHHYTEAGDKKKSLEYVLPAAEKASDNYANEEAIRYYRIGIELLEEKGQRGEEIWVKAKEGLVDVYLTLGMSNESIELCTELLKYKKKEIEKAVIYRKIGNAYFKKGDWKKCEDNLGKGLELLGEKLPKNKTEVIFSMLKELTRHIIHGIFFKKHIEKERRNINKKDTEIIFLYLTLNWMYILTDINKFIRSVLRTLNICESRIGKDRVSGIALGGYGSLLMAIPLFRGALRYHYRSLKLRKELKDEWGVAQSLQWLGYCYSWQGEYRKCLEIFKQAEDKFAEMGDMWELGMIMQGTGQGHVYLSEYQTGLEYLTQYLDISKKINDDYGVCAALSDLALCYIESGFYDKAYDAGLKSLKQSLDNKIWFITCSMSSRMGYLEIERGNYQKAIDYITKARELYENNTFLKDYTVYVYSFLAKASIEELKTKKDNRLIEQNAGKIKKICKEALKNTKHWANHYGRALRVMAEFYSLTNKKNKAERYFVKSIEQTNKIDRKFEMAVGYYEYGQFLNEAGKKKEAKLKWEQALNVFKEIGSNEYIKRCSKVLGLGKPDEKAIEESPQDRLKVERRMTTVLGTSRYLSSILDLDELLEKIMDKTMEMVGAERGILLLYPDDKRDKDLDIRVIRNVEKGQLRGEAFISSQSLIEKVEKEKKPIIVEDAGTDTQLKGQSSVVKYGLKSVLCAPIMARGNMLGVIYLDNRLVTGLFSQEDLMVLDLISNQAGVSIENARLYQRAITDGLTGLYNRIFFDNYLMKSVDEASRYKKNLSLIIIDIDHFKRFNDDYGHQTGDMVLKRVSNTIKDNVRISDIAARYGGDEFVIILPETDSNGAESTALKICQKTEDMKLDYNRGKKTKKLKVTLSMGVASLTEGENRLELVEKADESLYKAKEAGRNCVFIFGKRGVKRPDTKIKKRC
ncbi:MAG: diguanylate cyclase [Spirochaetes bacterium]|nr:diguanylate cyclase [Spirochaetota bacterium]